MYSRAAFVISAVMLSVAVALPAQEPVGRFSSRVQVVEVYATVSDGDGPVAGLRQEDFQILEDGVPQPISVFAAGEFPLTVALGVDRSASMTGEPLRLAKAASQAFLRQLKPDDRSMVVAIGNDADVVAPLAMDRAAQIRAIGALDAWSTTSLHDAIIAALDRLDEEPGRQALVVFSDGSDRYSRHSAAEVLERVRRSTALIYPIAISRTRPPLLSELAVLTGGRSFQIRSVAQLDGTLSTIARELRQQYLLGYEPQEVDSGDAGRWHSIQVKLAARRPGLRVRARDGYRVD